MDHRFPPIDIDLPYWEDPDYPFHSLWYTETDLHGYVLSPEDRAEGLVAVRQMLGAVVAFGKWLWRSL